MIWKAYSTQGKTQGKKPNTHLFMQLYYYDQLCLTETIQRRGKVCRLIKPSISIKLSKKDGNYPLIPDGSVTSTVV